MRTLIKWGRNRDRDTKPQPRELAAAAASARGQALAQRNGTLTHFAAGHSRALAQLAGGPCTIRTARRAA